MNTAELACRQDPDMWFSEDTLVIPLAQAACEPCPAKEECYLLGLKNREKFGVWGGVNFNSLKLESEVKLCRNKLHPLPNGGNCKECRKISYDRYEANKPKRIYKPKQKKKNSVGGYCKAEHLLDEGNYTIRSYDKAVVCLTCRKIARKKWHQNKDRVYIKAGDFN